MKLTGFDYIFLITVVQNLNGLPVIYIIYIFSTIQIETVEAPTPETIEPNTPKPDLPQLEPGDQLLIGPSTHTDKDSPVEKRNVLNKITERSKDILSIVYPPYEEERNEQKFDDSERKKAEKYALSNDQVLLTDALTTKGVVSRSRSVSKPTPLAQVVEGRVITESTKDKLEGIEGNSKLWIGKDYTNFIVKDFNSLDLPFVGECYCYFFVCFWSC